MRCKSGPLAFYSTHKTSELCHSFFCVAIFLRGRENFKLHRHLMKSGSSEQRQGFLTIVSLCFKNFTLQYKYNRNGMLLSISIDAGRFNFRDKTFSWSDGRQNAAGQGRASKFRVVWCQFSIHSIIKRRWTNLYVSLSSSSCKCWQILKECNRHCIFSSEKMQSLEHNLFVWDRGPWAPPPCGAAAPNLAALRRIEKVLWFKTQRL